MILKSRYVAALVLVLGFSVMKASSQTLPSLMLSQDPVALSSGMASVASGPDAYALQNNVASMSLSDATLDAQVGFGLWQPSYANMKQFGGAAMAHFGKIGVGLDVKSLRMQPYGAVSGSGADIRDSEFVPGEFNIAVGVSYAIVDCLSAGLALRYATSELSADASATVFGADVALYFKKDALSAGLSVNNLGTKVKYSETAYPQPMMAKIGAGYDLDLGTSALLFTAQADVLFAGSVMAGAGVEYSFNDMVFARAGYHYGNSVDALPSYASAGLGVKIFGIQLNAAYLFASEVLANSMSLSLGYTF